MIDSSPTSWSFNPLLSHPVRLWLAACYNVTALPVAAVTFSLIIAMLSTSAGLLVTFFIALPFAWLTFVLSRGFSHLERGRAEALAGARIADPVPPLTARGWWGRLKERAKSGSRWKEIAYHLVHLPVAAVGFALTMAAWCGSLAMLLLPLYVDRLPGNSAKFHFFEISQGAGALAASVVGLLGLVFVAPWVTVGVTRLSVAIARALLGPSADAVHAAQVQQLETSRTAAVDSAESERRRIERDLHGPRCRSRRGEGEDRRRPGGRSATPRRRPRGGEVGAQGDP
jgi:hypothetical protein